MKCLVVLLLGLTLILANDEAQDFVNANNLFTAPVYKQLVSLKKNEPNFLVSPFSAETVLALAHAGSKGKTADEIQTALHLPNNREKIKTAVKATLSAIKSNKLYSLHTANKIYIQQNFPIKEEFKQISTEFFHAASENIDFSRNEEAAKTMNKWVEDQTANKIKDLISSDLLSKDTVAVLINALYFKGSWSNQFEKFATKKEDFYKSSTDVVQVDTMHHYEEYLKYCECEELNAKFLEIPFEGGDISMTIILPNEKEGLSSLENQIDTVFAPQQLSMELVNVALPKFKIETEIDFKQVLINLGVEAAFDKDKADFTGIADKDYKVHITDVIQKTFINVGETGVEAAAATFVVMTRGDSVFDPLETIKPKEFKADHPFIFYIKAKNFIIFAGKVSSP